MICSKCGAYNPDYYVFCQNCFADLSDFGVPDGSEVPAGTASKRAKPPESIPRRQDFPEDTDREPIGEPPRDADAFLADEFVEDGIVESAPVIPTTHVDMPPIIEEPIPEEPLPPLREPMHSESAPFDRMQPPPPIEPTSEISTAQRPNAASKPSAAELRRQRKEAEREARELQKLQANQGAEYYDYYDYYDEAALRKERRRSHVVALIFVLIVLAACISTAAVGAAYLNKTYGSIQAGIDAILGGRMPVSVEPYEGEDGTTGHKITIAGKKGQILSFRDPEINQAFELVSDEPISYRLDDSSWIHVNPEAEQATLTISPDVILTDPDGTETPVEVPSFTINVPEVALTLSKPNPTEGVTVDGGVLEISGKADAGGKPVRVYVAEYLLGENEIDANGNFNARIAVANDFDILVVASSDRMRSMSVRIQGTAMPSGEFVINESFSTPVESETVTVTGTAPTGGELQITGTAGDIQYNADDGQFSFVARLPAPGLHTFTLQVGDTTQNLAIRRVPEVNAYTGSAVPLDYAAVLAAPGENIDKVFSFDATVASITTQTPVYTMKMSVNGDANQSVDVTYFGMAQPQVGETYRVYASANGNNENNTVVRVNAFFIYDLSALSGTSSTAAPTPETE